MILILLKQDRKAWTVNSLSDLEVGLVIESSIDGILQDYLVLYRDGYQTIPLRRIETGRIVTSIETRVDHERILRKFDQKEMLSDATEFYFELPTGSFEILRLVDLPLSEFLKEIGRIQLKNKQKRDINSVIQEIVNRSSLSKDLKSKITDLNSIEKLKSRLLKESSVEAFILISLLKQNELRQEEFTEKGSKKTLLSQMSNEDLKIVSKCPGLFSHFIWPS